MKKIIFFLYLSLLPVLFPLILPAQNFQKYYDRDFGSTNSIGEVGHAVQQTSDGGYIAVGYSDNYGIGMKDIYVVRLNASGDTLWTKLYGNAGGNDMARAVIQTSDGGFAIAGETQSGAGLIDATITKIDANGTLLWSKAFGGSKDDLGHAIIEMSDEGLVLAGQALSYSANSYDEIFLIKVDKNGTLLWAKTLNGGGGELARDIAKTSDGGFIIAGEENSFNYGVFLAKFTSNGDTSWCKTYRAAYSSYEGFGVNQTSDGGYIVAANTYGGSIGGKDMIALKVSSTGAISWTKEIGTINTEMATDIIQTNDGGYVISGTAMPGGSYYDLVMAKLNSSGTLQWSKNYSGDYGTTYATDPRFQVIETSNHGLMTIGSLYNNFGNTLPALYNGYDMMIVKTDSSGGGITTGCIRNANMQSATASWTAYGTPFTVTAVSPTITGSVYIQKLTAGNSGDVAIKINMSATTASCGSCDGSATANPCDSMGYYCSGKNPYAFSWSDNLNQATQTATSLCLGTYTVTVTDYVGCTGINSVTVSSGAVPVDICLVTVDSTSTKNLIIWEKPVSTSIDSFIIYREIGLNNYVKIGAVAYAALSKFVDTVQGINPNTTSYRYKISTLDNCSNESAKSAEHKTIHLQISQAIPQGANLSWTDYLGFSFSQYRILRDSNNTNNWEALDSVSFSITSYTDGQQFNNARYIVEATNPSGCIVSKSIENHNSSRSNKTYPLMPQGLSGRNQVSETGFHIYPNPNEGNFEVHVAGMNGFEKGVLRIFDILGELVYQEQIPGPVPVTIDFSNSQKGIYMAEFQTGSRVLQRKLIVK